MKYLIISRLLCKIGLVVIFVLLVDPNSEEQVLRAEIGVPTVTGLSFDDVEFVLWTEYEYHDRLYARAIERFKEAGLYNKTDGIKTPQEKAPELVLRLESAPFGEVCPGKIMYVEKLELWERVRPVRNPQISSWSVTWSFGLPTPSITDKVTIEQLEADLDRLIKEFIIAYKMGNPIKKKK
jgi:hypothetical protein